MDIDLLSKMVKELILDNDRVVLPGLGSFVAEVVPSTFSDKGYTINPPYRRLYFRAAPSEGGELIGFYAKTNKVSEEVAERIIRDFVTEMRQILHTKKTVVFPGLGRLRATKENNVFFVADEGLDIYPAGFGLEPVSLKTHQETNEEVAAAVVGLKELLDDVSQMEVVPTVEPAPSVEPDAAAEPDPAVEQVVLPEVEPEPRPDMQPAVQPEPEPVQEPAALETEETPSVQPELSPLHSTLNESEPRNKTFVKVLIVAACILLLLTITYAIAGRMFPEWIDQYLYTSEELEILNRQL